jgi:hypothetical protein
MPSRATAPFTTVTVLSLRARRVERGGVPGAARCRFSHATDVAECCGCLPAGIKESDTGLSKPSLWDLVGDKQLMGEPPLLVCSVRCGDGAVTVGGAVAVLSLLLILQSLLLPLLLLLLLLLPSLLLLLLLSSSSRFSLLSLSLPHT